MILCSEKTLDATAGIHSICKYFLPHENDTHPLFVAAGPVPSIKSSWIYFLLRGSAEVLRAGGGSFMLDCRLPLSKCDHYYTPSETEHDFSYYDILLQIESPSLLSFWALFCVTWSPRLALKKKKTRRCTTRCLIPQCCCARGTTCYFSIFYECFFVFVFPGR